MPWWIDFLVDAKEWNCPPWELYDGYNNKPFWRACQSMFRGVRQKAQQAIERDAEKQLKRARAA